MFREGKKKNNFPLLKPWRRGGKQTNKEKRGMTKWRKNQKKKKNKKEKDTVKA